MPGQWTQHGALRPAGARGAVRTDGEELSGRASAASSSGRGHDAAVSVGPVRGRCALHRGREAVAQGDQGAGTLREGPLGSLLRPRIQGTGGLVKQRQSREGAGQFEPLGRLEDRCTAVSCTLPVEGLPCQGGRSPTGWRADARGAGGGRRGGRPAYGPGLGSSVEHLDPQALSRQRSVRALRSRARAGPRWSPARRRRAATCTRHSPVRPTPVQQGPAGSSR